MLFNSYEFIFLFLPITLILYFWLNKYNKNKLAKTWLVIASLYFYSYFHKSYLILITISILVNYFIGQKLSSNKYNVIQRKILLIVGVVFNLGGLGYFKYYDFFVSNINSLLGTNFTLLHILLPLGISFFTFQQLSFIVDSYKRYDLTYDFLDYCLFVTFFPQLIAGPIVLPTEMLPQFEAEENKKINWENMNKGLYIFSIGLVKKVIIADTVSKLVNFGYSRIESLGILEVWLTSLAYTLQLYFDFSGYCDMAIGIGLMFNIILPANFNSPYKSTNIQEFWKRWHMTLGRFMTNYLYIPLGGNRKGEKKMLRNLFIVFLASGIWHGAGWNFIIWGILHGTCIVIHRVWKKSGRKLNKLMGWFITINLVNIFWIFFRSKTLMQSILILKKMFNLHSKLIFEKNVNNFLVNLGGKKWLLEFILIFFIAIVLIFFKVNSLNKMEKYNFSAKKEIEIIFYMVFSILSLSGVSSFLYFNF